MQTRRMNWTIPSPFHSRNRWARYGRALANFLAAFLVAVATYLLEFLLFILKRGFVTIICGGVMAFINWRRDRKAVCQQSKTMAVQSSKPARASSEFQPIKVAGVTFDDVVGLQAAKDALRRMVINPMLHPEQAAELKVKPGGGVLLVGPPGNGKTMLAKAVAGMLRAQFLHVTLADIRGKDSDRRINNLFAAAGAYEFSVVFFDEMDAMFPSRGGSPSNRVNQALDELDGVGRTSAGRCMLVLGATNNLPAIDRAIVRPGRFDIQVEVPLPDVASIKVIVQKNLEGRPVERDVNLDALASGLAGCSGAEVAGIVAQAGRICLDRNIRLGPQHAKEHLGKVTSPISMADLILAATDIARRTIAVPLAETAMIHGAAAV